MHAAWYIQEIRDLILELLEPGDLARLARTNSELFESATDLLWSRLTTLEPFLWCLPPDFGRRPLQSPEELTRLDMYSSKVHVICMEDTRRIIPLPGVFGPKKQTPKAKPGPHLGQGLGLSKQEHLSLRFSLWIDAWKQISRLRSNHKFLPNLRKLRVNKISEALLQPFVGISGSSLAHIHIRSIEERRSVSVVQQFLEQLSDVPKLRYVFVRSSDPHIIPEKIMEQSQLTQLRLEARTVQASDYSAYSQSPLRTSILKMSSLRCLSISLSWHWYSPDFFQLPNDCLPNLKSLWLDLTPCAPSTCHEPCANVVWDHHTRWPPQDRSKLDRRMQEVHDCGWRSPAVFFEKLRPRCLEVLVVKLPHHIDRTSMRSVIHSVSTSFQLQNLTELALTTNDSPWHCGDCDGFGGGSPRVQSYALRESLALLMPLPKLKTLRLTICPNPLEDWDSAFVTMMAEALPHLENVTIGTEIRMFNPYAPNLLPENFTFPEVKRTSVRDIAAFCSHFPLLKNVDRGPC